MWTRLTRVVAQRKSPCLPRVRAAPNAEFAPRYPASCRTARLANSRLMTPLTITTHALILRRCQFFLLRFERFIDQPDDGVHRGRACRGFSRFRGVFFV